MRLIDADAEIVRIEQEMQRIDAKIERLKKMAVKEQFNTLHNFEKELEQCYRNKADCKTEITTLKNYQTAYDVDKVIERLEEKTDIEYKRYMDCNSATPAVIYSRYETQYHERAECLKIVRAGMDEAEGDKEA